MNSHQPLTINHQPLQEGDVLNLPSSGLAEVISVNEFRARVRSLDPKATVREWGISPNSEVEVIQKSEVRGQKSE